MTFANLASTVHNLMKSGDFAKAEEVLSQSRREAKQAGDAETLNYILTELIGLCRLSNPPAWLKAEALSREREAVLGTGFSKLQTAMILYQGLEDYTSVVPKLEEAIAQGRSDRDEQTVYTGLSLLGQAYLKLRNVPGAVGVLEKIEEMVTNKGKFVVGDETSFLEALRMEGLEADRVTQLAFMLESACRDPAFKKRLAILAGNPNP